MYQWVDILLIPRSSITGRDTIDVRFVQAEDGCEKTRAMSIKAMVEG
jgi:hypothetical protein